MLKSTLKGDFYTTEDTDKGIQKAIERIAKVILKDAKNKHRYKDRTGRLNRATIIDITEKRVQAIINDNIAKYGKYVHNGTKKWRKDPFIENAIVNNSDVIDKIFGEELDKSYGRA